ncbi:unnamed protein product [Leptidea sinapis]|uniref:Uncharacterized protein n=1 Tax=Leptidea sinapis TaxID=189913 RepID=A0A5E4QH58_9NEOP|nr:unnamed protein product [Leptidea sinapis]
MSEGDLVFSYETSPRGNLHQTGSPRTIPRTTVSAGPSTSGMQSASTPSSSSGWRILKARRSLPLRDEHIYRLLADSGSYGDSAEEEVEEMEEEHRVEIEEDDEAIRKRIELSSRCGSGRGR